MDLFIARRGGGGGAELNFEVVGSTVQPENPKENTIWVDTPNEITGWIFSAAEPENLQEGMVWFPTDTSSPVEFNALKENRLQVYPLAARARQMVDGMLVNRVAKIYQGGKWVELTTVLWNASENYENFAALGSKGFYITKNNTSGGTLEKSSAGMVMNSHRDDNIVAVSHDNPIDFTHLSQITVSWAGGKVYENYQGIGVYPINNDYAFSKAIALLPKYNTSAETVTLDVSDIDQKAYIIIYAYNGALTVSEIYME